MAKINLTTQHKQENLSALTSLGVLICMIVTLVGIKLWWFKHRLSFEQKTSTGGSANRAATSPGLVPRRSKQPKYKKDKRYSQQIYESVEVHGVFRQRLDDDLEIQRPIQLPPVRIREASESDACIIRPPPRTKRRDQVHSTAFEAVEIATPTRLITSSSSDLTITPEFNTKITLTFEEFEKQFNLTEAKSTNINKDTIENPKPPLRLNRSSTSTAKAEKKPEHFLKSSQSITMPEFHKVIEKRSVTSSSPKADLTKIDLYEEATMFDNFSQPKVTSAGYIKYEEVDNELHERELNSAGAEDQLDNNFTDRGFCANTIAEMPVKAPRNDHVNSHSDSSDSLADQLTRQTHFNREPYRPQKEWQEVDLTKQSTAMKSNEMKYPISKENIIYRVGDRTSHQEFEKDSANFEKNYVNESKPVKADTTLDGKNNEQGLHEFVKDSRAEDDVEFMKNVEVNKETQNIVTEFNSRNVPLAVDENLSVEEKISSAFRQNPFTATEDENLDNQLDSWPQFEDKIEIPQVTVRRFNRYNLETQNSFNENNDSESSSIHSPKNDDKVGVSLKERRPTGYANYRPESPEFEDIEEWQRSFDKKFYNQVRSFITDESLKDSPKDHAVSFDSSEPQKLESATDKFSALKQRRPTGYARHNEYFVTLSDESDEEVNDDSNALQRPKVQFEDDNLGSDLEADKFTLNERRPTGFVRLSTEDQHDVDETKIVKEAEKNEHASVKQRRPTGFITKLEILDLSNSDSRDPERDIRLYTESVAEQRRPTEHGKQNNSPAFEDKCETLIKQRGPPAYKSPVISTGSSTADVVKAEQHSQAFEQKIVRAVRQKVDPTSSTFGLVETEKNSEEDSERRSTKYSQPQELFSTEKQVSFQWNIENNKKPSQPNKALQQRRPTGFTRKEAVTKHVNFELNESNEKSEYENEQLKQRRPTGFISSRKEFKCLDQPAPIYRPPNESRSKPDFDDALWQELENDVTQDVIRDFEEEFSKIRHSYELNEADFLELKDELQKSPTDMGQPPLGFGKTIEDDWENFEKLENQIVIKPLPRSEEKIHITYSDNDTTSNTTSILKDTKLDEEVIPRPRKSKVTFDFKTEEHVIPARKSLNYCIANTEDDEDDDDSKDSALILPQPLKRASNINYNHETSLTTILATPTSIALFGSPRTTENKEVEDSWSVIRKYRATTANNLQHFPAGESSQNLPATSLDCPPKPAYRNPMAQLVIQRAKEVRADMDGFRSRSINDRKPEAASRQRQKLYNLNNGEHEEGTEA